MVSVSFPTLFFQQNKSSVKPKSSQPLQFGWAEGHQIADQATFNNIQIAELGLPFNQRKLFKFLKDSQSMLAGISRGLDIPANSKTKFSHWLNWQTRGLDYEAEASFNTTGLDTISRLMAAMTRPNLRSGDIKKESWANVEQYDSGRLTEEGNVVKNAFVAFQSLVNIFLEISEKNLSQNACTVQDREQLLKALAVVMHMVGDIHQPLHVNSFFSWKTWRSFPTQRGREQNIHSFMESYGEILTHMQVSFDNKKPLETLTDTEIKKRLLHAAKQSFSKFNIIRQADLDSRRAGREIYLTTLAKTLVPIINEQLTAAARLNAELIWTAYHRAGCPDLSVFDSSH